MSTPHKPIYLQLEDVSERDEENLLSDLESFLSSQNISGMESLHRVKDDSRSMDMGATLGIILGTASVVAVANGIADWLGRRNVKMKLIDGNRKQIVSGVSSEDAVKLAEAFRKS